MSLAEGLVLHHSLGFICQKLRIFIRWSHCVRLYLMELSPHWYICVREWSGSDWCFQVFVVIGMRFVKVGKQTREKALHNLWILDGPVYVWWYFVIEKMLNVFTILLWNEKANLTTVFDGFITLILSINRRLSFLWDASFREQCVLWFYIWTVALNELRDLQWKYIISLCGNMLPYSYTFVQRIYQI